MRSLVRDLELVHFGGKSISNTLLVVLVGADLEDEALGLAIVIEAKLVHDLLRAESS